MTFSNQSWIYEFWFCSQNSSFFVICSKCTFQFGNQNKLCLGSSQIWYQKSILVILVFRSMLSFKNWKVNAYSLSHILSLRRATKLGISTLLNRGLCSAHYKLGSYKILVIKFWLDTHLFLVKSEQTNFLKLC